MNIFNMISYEDEIYSKINKLFTFGIIVENNYLNKLQHYYKNTLIALNKLLLRLKNNKNWILIL